jgi:hypothetical protein
MANSFIKIVIATTLMGVYSCPMKNCFFQGQRRICHFKLFLDFDEKEPIFFDKPVSFLAHGALLGGRGESTLDLKYPFDNQRWHSGQCQKILYNSLGIQAHGQIHDE